MNHLEIKVEIEVVVISNGNQLLSGWDTNVIVLDQAGSKLLLVGDVCIVRYEQK